MGLGDVLFSPFTAYGNVKRADDETKQWTDWGVGQFDQIDSPQARQISKMIRTNPQAATRLLDSYGGIDKVHTLLRSQQARAMADDAMKDYVRGLPQGQPIDERSMLRSFAERGVPPEGMAAYFGPRQALAEIEKTQAETYGELQPKDKRTALEKNLELLDYYRKTGQQEKAALVLAELQGSQFSVEAGPDGQFSVRQGKGLGGGAAKTPAAVQTERQHKLDNALEMQSRSENLLRGLSPDMFTYQQQLGTFTREKLSKLGLPPDADANAIDSAYRMKKQETLKLFEDVIRAATGAVINKDEMETYENILPSMDDSFEAYVDAARGWERLMGQAARRKRYLIRTEGAYDVAHPGMTIEQVQVLYEQRGDELAQEISAQNPEISPEQLNQAVEQALREEF
jgi:hypothetical protein